MYYVRCFGELALEDGTRHLGPRDLGGVKAKQLFEVLLAASGSTVSKHRIADLLWGEALPRNYAAAIESHVSVLRRHLSAELPAARSMVSTEPGGYRVRWCDQVRCDLVDFDELATKAAAGTRDAAERFLTQAVALLRGDVLEDEPYAPWAQSLRFTYRPRIIRALLDVARFRLECGDLDNALQLARRVVDMDPAVEAAYQIEMVACYQVGRQDEAIRSFLRCREILRTELAVEPLDATIELADAVRRHDSAWLAHWSRTSTASPFRRAS